MLELVIDAKNRANKFEEQKQAARAYRQQQLGTAQQQRQAGTATNPLLADAERRARAAQKGQ